MGGGAQHRRAVGFGRLDDDPPGLAQRLSRLGHRSAHPGVGLDLGANHLACYLVRLDAGLAGFEDRRFGVGDEVARIGVDEKEFLLHPDCYLQVFSIIGFTHDALSRKRRRPHLLRTLHVRKEWF